MNDMPHVKQALKSYFQYFAVLWVLIFGISVYLQSMNEQFRNTYASDFYMAMTLLQLTALVFILRQGNRPFGTINASRFAVQPTELGASVLVGAALGYLLPLVGAIGIHFSPDSVLYNMTERAITGLADTYRELTGFAFIISVFVYTILISIGRELLFRGLMFPLFIRDMSINRATLQISLLVVLAGYIFQWNIMDVISIFCFSVFMCYIMYRTGSLLNVIMATIAYDLPFLYLFSNDWFYAAPIRYVTPQLEFIWLYMLLGGIAYYGVRMINRSQHAPLQP